MRKAVGLLASRAAVVAVFLFVVHTGITDASAQSPKKPVSIAATATTSTDPELSSLEQEIFREINLARANPREYAAHLERLKPYFSGNTFQPPGKTPLVTNEGWSAVDEAIRFLRALPALPPLSVSRGMCLGALEHVKDQKASGLTGHKGSDNSFCEQRVMRFGAWQESIGENLIYGTDAAREKVLTLLIDDGVANRGHRKRIMSSEYKVVGVSCGDHAKLGGLCVLTFAGGFRDNLAGNPAIGKPATPAPAKPSKGKAPRQF